MEEHAKAASSILGGGETVHVSKLKSLFTSIAAEVWPAFISDESKESALALLVAWKDSAAADKIALLEAILDHKNQGSAPEASSDVISSMVAEVQSLARRLRSDMTSSVRELANELGAAHEEITALKAQLQALEAKIEALVAPKQEEPAPKTEETEQA